MWGRFFCNSATLCIYLFIVSYHMYVLCHLLSLLCESKQTTGSTHQDSRFVQETVSVYTIIWNSNSMTPPATSVEFWQDIWKTQKLKLQTQDRKTNIIARKSLEKMYIILMVSQSWLKVLLSLDLWVHNICICYSIIPRLDLHWFAPLFICTIKITIILLLNILFDIF